MIRSASAAGLLAAAVLLQLAEPPVPTYAASPVCYVVNSLERVAPDTPPPANPATEITVSAAANEYEGVHVIVYGGDEGLNGVDLGLAGPLTSAGGTTLAAGTVAFYREHYVAVSSRSGGSPLAAPGVYPDALIPFRNPFTGGPIGALAYPAAPFAVAARRNQPVYVEFFIPPSARPGVYRGAVRVVSGGGAPLAEIPVSVEVWDFALPSASSLRSCFQSYDSDYRLGAARYYGYEYGSPQHVAAAAAADELLLGHRLVPTSPMGTAFNVAPDGSIAPTPEQAARILTFLARPGYTDFRIPFSERFPFDGLLSVNRERAKTYLRSALEWMRARGFAGKLHLRPGDEPASTAQFIEIRDTALLAHEVDPGIRVGMTVALAGARTQEYLLGAVNLLIAAYSDFDPALAARRLSAGDEIWTYTALVQNPSRPTPYWQIDFPLLNYRVVNWINFRYSVTGLLYWTSANWEGAVSRGTSPWTDPRSSCFGAACYNGEGLLLYPGKEVNFVVPQGAYGPYSRTPVYGPVPSLRLKTLRDAMEDYEYLVMASGMDPAAALDAAVEIGCAGDPHVNCFTRWNTSPEALLDARRRLARRIASGRRRSVPPGEERSIPDSGRGR